MSAIQHYKKRYYLVCRKPSTNEHLAENNTIGLVILPVSVPASAKGRIREPFYILRIANEHQQ